MTTEPKILPSEGGHWYDKQGNPVYEVPRADGKGMRPTTLADARKLNLKPSVTNVINVAAKPGLEAWKAKQLLEASLTLPRLPQESLDDYAVRVIEDSKAQSLKAMQRGIDLHATIEQYISTRELDDKWVSHAVMVRTVLGQYGINIFEGRAEHSFASPIGYGGKIDFHTNEILIDFKTKDFINDKKQLAWPEHCWQLAAYRHGAMDTLRERHEARLLNVFIGVEDCQVRLHEWTPEDATKGWEVFSHLLSVWKLVKGYSP